MSRAKLKNKKLRLEYRFLLAEKEDVDAAMVESESELRKFKWYLDLCEKVLGHRPEPKPEAEEDPWEGVSEWERQKWERKGWKSPPYKTPKPKSQSLLSAKGENIWMEDAPDEIKELFEKLFGEDEGESKKETKNRAPVDKRIRKLYRKVVDKTHPDKVGEAYVDYFRRATKAYQSGDFGDLLEVADELDIPIPPGLEKERSKFLQKQIDELKIWLQGRKNTIGWLWAEAGSEEEKEEIKNRFCSCHGIQP